MGFQASQSVCLCLVLGAVHICRCGVGTVPKGNRPVARVGSFDSNWLTGQPAGSATRSCKMKQLRQAGLSALASACAWRAWAVYISVRCLCGVQGVIEKARAGID